MGSHHPTERDNTIAHGPRSLHNRHQQTDNGWWGMILFPNKLNAAECAAAVSRLPTSLASYSVESGEFPYPHMGVPKGVHPVCFI